MFSIGQSVKFNGKGTITDIPKGSVGVVANILWDGSNSVFIVNFGIYGIRYIHHYQIESVQKLNRNGKPLFVRKGEKVGGGFFCISSRELLLSCETFRNAL